LVEVNTTTELSVSVPKVALILLATTSHLFVVSPRYKPADSAKISLLTTPEILTVSVAALPNVTFPVVVKSPVTVNVVPLNVKLASAFAAP
jgi:hypothetical protein